MPGTPPMWTRIGTSASGAGMMRPRAASRSVSPNSRRRRRCSRSSIGDAASLAPIQLFQMNVRCADKVARANILLAHEDRELLRRAADDLVAEIRELLAHAGVVQCGDG